MGEDKKKGAVKKEDSPKKKVSTEAKAKGSKENVNNNASPKKDSPSKKKAEDKKAEAKKADPKKAEDQKTDPNKGDKKMVAAVVGSPKKDGEADKKKAEDKKDSAEKVEDKKDGAEKAEDRKDGAEVKSPEVESKDLPKEEEGEEKGEKEKNGAVPKTPEVEENASNGTAARSQSIESEAEWVIRLTYFDGQGRAELIRIILAAGEVEYVDRRVTRQRWAELKDDTPFGQLPILECEGQVIAQSLSIARYLAKRTGLYGDSILDQARADAVVDFVGDFYNKWVNVFRAQEIEERVIQIKSFMNEFLPEFMRNAEDMLKEAGGQYFVGDKLSFADIAMFQALWSFSDPEDPFYRTLPEPISQRFSVMKHFPLLSGLLDTVANVKGIRRWLQTRPLGVF